MKIFPYPLTNWKKTVIMELLTKRVVNGVTHEYFYDGDKLIAEKVGDKYFYFFYDESGVCGFRYENINYEYVKNIFGDVIGIYNEYGTHVATYAYDAWGNMTYCNAGTDVAYINPFLYRGYYYDNESGLYYLMSRYYDPKIGRFISPDTPDYLKVDTIGGVDLYAYGLNNPVMYVDPTGHFIWEALGCVVRFYAIVIACEVAIISGNGSDLIDDWNNGALNPYNTDKEIALKSKVMGFYKGELVIRHSIPKTTSCQIFGTIFLNSKVQYNADGITTLNHEWGHSQQERQMGFTYLFNVVIPSLTGYFLAGQGKLPCNYYALPWEYEADYYGGVNRGVEEEEISFWDLVNLFFI